MRFFAFVTIAAAAFTSQAEAIQIERNEYSYAQLETVAQPPDAKFTPRADVPSFKEDPNHPYWRDYDEDDPAELRRATRKYAGDGRPAGELSFPACEDDKLHCTADANPFVLVLEAAADIRFLTSSNLPVNHCPFSKFFCSSSSFQLQIRLSAFHFLF